MLCHGLSLSHSCLVRRASRPCAPLSSSIPRLRAALCPVTKLATSQVTAAAAAAAAAAQESVAASLDKKSVRGLERDLKKTRSLEELAACTRDHLGTVSSDRKVVKLVLRATEHRVRVHLRQQREREPAAGLSASGAAAAKQILSAVHSRAGSAFTACSSAHEVVVLLDFFSELAWISQQPLKEEASRALHMKLSTRAVLGSWFPCVTAASTNAGHFLDEGSSSSSSSSSGGGGGGGSTDGIPVLCSFLGSYLRASKAGLRPGPLPYAFLVHIIEVLGTACVPEQERATIAACVREIASAEGPGAIQQQQQQQSQGEEQAGTTARERLSASEEEVLARCAALPCTTLPQVLACLEAVSKAVYQAASDQAASNQAASNQADSNQAASKHASRNQGTQGRAKGQLLRPLADIVAAAFHKGDQLLSTAPQGAGAEARAALLRYAAGLLPTTTPHMADSGVCAVTRALSQWCSGGQKGLGTPFAKALRPRLHSPAFLKTAEAHDVLPELLAFCAGQGESSAAVAPVLRHAAKPLEEGASKALRWSEPRALKMLSAIESAGWDAPSSRDIVEICFASYGHCVADPKSRWCALAEDFLEEPSGALSEGLLSGLALAAVRQTSVGGRLGIARFILCNLEREETKSLTRPDPSPWLAPAARASLRILRAMDPVLDDAGTHRAHVPESTEQWVTIAKVASAASAANLSARGTLSDPARTLAKVIRALESSPGLEKLGALQLVNLACAAIRCSKAGNDASMMRVISVTNSKLQFLDGEQLAECAKHQVLPQQRLSTQALPLLRSTFREASAKLREDSMDGKGLASLLEATARLHEDERTSGIMDAELIPEACLCLAERSQQLVAQQLDQLSRSLVALNYYEASLLDAMCLRALGIQSRSETPSVLYCCAYLNHSSPAADQLFFAWAQEFGPAIPSMRLGQISRIAWAYAVKDINPRISSHKEQYIVDILAEVVLRHSVQQLRQSSAVVRGSLGFAARIWAAMEVGDKKLIKKLQARMAQVAHTGSQVSEWEKDVRKELERGTVIEVERVSAQVDVGLGWITDVLVLTRAPHSGDVKEVCVELDGPTHFASIRSGEGVSRSHVLGKTAIRDKCLQKMGKRLVSIPNLAQGNKHSRQRQMEVLRERIQQAAST